MNIVASGNIGSFGGNGAGPNQFTGGGVAGMSRLGPGAPPGIGSSNTGTDGSGGSITGGMRKKARLN